MLRNDLIDGVRRLIYRFDTWLIRHREWPEPPQAWQILDYQTRTHVQVEVVRTPCSGKAIDFKATYYKQEQGVLNISNMNARFANAIRKMIRVYYQDWYVAYQAKDYATSDKLRQYMMDSGWQPMPDGVRSLDLNWWFSLDDMRITS